MEEREKKHIAKLIGKEVSYFNGWSVTQEQMEADIMKAAEKISKYVDKKIKDNVRTIYRYDDGRYL